MSEDQVEILTQPDELSEEDLDDVAGGGCGDGSGCCDGLGSAEEKLDHAN